VPALDGVTGLRVVADARAIDDARWVAAGGSDVTLLRIAPDEVIAIDAVAVELDDGHAIVVDERGLVAATCPIDDVRRRTEWPLTAEAEVSQGAVAGVPVKLVRLDADHVRIFTAAAYAHDLADRLDWPT
jgi:hypothetical protein